MGETGLNLYRSLPNIFCRTTVATGNDFLQLRSESTGEPRKFRQVRARSEASEAVRQRCEALAMSTEFVR
jgi:hypothetical protein